MKTQPPNAAQKRWREQVRELGSIISGGPAVIHHCVGRTAKHQKLSIGHWFILPLTDEEHKDMHADPNRKEREKDLFAKVCDQWLEAQEVGEWTMSVSLPFDGDTLRAIMDYHK